MDAVCTTGERHIEPIVDDDAGLRAPGKRDHCAHERGKRARGKVPFSNLHDVNPGLDRVTRLFEEASALLVIIRSAGVTGAEASTVGDEMKNQGRTCVSASSLNGTSRRARAVKIGAISANPATRLTMPRPLIAPRPKWLVRMAPSAGTA